MILCVARLNATDCLLPVQTCMDFDDSDNVSQQGCFVNGSNTQPYTSTPGPTYTVLGITGKRDNILGFGIFILLLVIISLLLAIYFACQKKKQLTTEITQSSFTVDNDEESIEMNTVTQGTPMCGIEIGHTDESDEEILTTSTIARLRRSSTSDNLNDVGQSQNTSAFAPKKARIVHNSDPHVYAEADAPKEANWVSSADHSDA